MEQFPAGPRRALPEEPPVTAEPDNVVSFDAYRRVLADRKAARDEADWKQKNNAWKFESAAAASKRRHSPGTSSTPPVATWTGVRPVDFTPKEQPNVSYLNPEIYSFPDGRPLDEFGQPTDEDMPRGFHPEIIE